MEHIIEKHLNRKRKILEGLFGCFGGAFIIVGFFSFLFSFNYEFPKVLVSLYIFGIIGIIFFILEYKISRDNLFIYMILMIIFVYFGVPTYGTYVDYKLNHFFDNNEILKCNKDISKCEYGVLAVNPKLNYFFCADSGERKGSEENNPLTCEWRAKWNTS